MRKNIAMVITFSFELVDNGEGIAPRVVFYLTAVTVCSKLEVLTPMTSDKAIFRPWKKLIVLLLL